VISPSKRPPPKQHKTNTRVEYPCPQRYSNPQPQQSSCCIPTLQTAGQQDQLFIHFNKNNLHDYLYYLGLSRTRWPLGLRCGSTAARLLGLRVRFPPRALTPFSCEWWLLSGRSLCEGPIPRTEQSYRVWPARGCRALRKTVVLGLQVFEQKPTRWKLYLPESLGRVVISGLPSPTVIRATSKQESYNHRRNGRWPTMVRLLESGCTNYSNCSFPRAPANRKVGYVLIITTNHQDAFQSHDIINSGEYVGT